MNACIATALAALLLCIYAPAHAADAPLAPPISLSLNNATLKETATALSKSAGIAISAPDQADSAARFTVELKDKPFWEVFRALSAQSPLQFTETSAGLQLQAGDPGWRVLQYSGDMAIIPGEFHYRQIVNLQPPPPPPAVRGTRQVTVLQDLKTRPLASLDLTYVFDPRLKVHRILARRVLSLVDDQGNALINRRPGNVNADLIPGLTFHYIENAPVNFNPPDHSGKRIASLDGDCIFEYMPTFQRFEIAPVDSLVGKDFENGNARIVIDAVTATGTLTRITGNAKGGGILEICDSDGRVVNLSSTVLPTNKPFSITAPMPPAKAPYKAIVTVGDVQQKTITFHLADLPLPLPQN